MNKLPSVIPGFESTDVKTSGAIIRLSQGGEGPPLLLLHGNPLTHASWHRVAPELAKHFRVIATDLRGYGDSSAPEPGENNCNYSFRAMAMDQVEVMEALGYREFYAAGHDRGARTVHRLCQDHPERVIKAAVLDIIPTRHLWLNMDYQIALGAWHWIFMAQNPDLPQQMMSSVDPEWFMKKKLGQLAVKEDYLPPHIFAEYVRCFNEKTIRGSCNDYRAAATCDLEMDKADFGTKITTPLLVLWGALGAIGKYPDNCLEVWKEYATNVRGEGLPCGHYVNEEAPEQCIEKLLSFFHFNSC